MEDFFCIVVFLISVVEFDMQWQHNAIFTSNSFVAKNSKYAF